METPLYKKKVAILDRLLKESSLTLQEALVLLQPDTEEIIDTDVQPESDLTGSATAFVYDSTLPESAMYTYILTDPIDK